MSNLILFGDFNAKTKTENDFIIIDKHDAFSSLETGSDVYHINRANQDVHDLDLHGKKLIDLCKTQNLLIVNGRVGEDKGVGQFTSKNNSVIDYVLAPPNFFSQFHTFQIHEFNPLLSDVHALISFEIYARHENDTESIENSFIPKIKWDQSKISAFLENFDALNLKKIEEKIETNDLSQNHLDDIVSDINQIFDDAKTKTFPVRPCKFIKKKPWYDGQLDLAKRNFSAARKRKNPENTRAHSKFYKKLLSAKFSSHTKKTAKNLRSLKTKDPKNFFKILKNSNKSCKSKISVGEFEKHFKNLNEVDYEETETDLIELNLDTDSDILQLLNAPLTEKELEKALKNLKNNKSAGPDGIVNEQIKATFSRMKDIYLKLFNQILDNGIFPETWAIGLIVPIFKKKGSANDPNSYRGITLISCLAKFFTSVLNNRLKLVADKIISQIQAGFREGYSTMDHVFTLLCIFALFKKAKKTIFLAFIDYQKAFDTIWRAELWRKLMKEGIGGKFLNVIKDMYAKSKSCVMVNSQKSDYFSSHAGVRQGENLSPLLFSFYINDLEDYLKNKNVQ